MKQRMTNTKAFPKSTSSTALNFVNINDREDADSLEYHVVGLAMSGKLAKTGQQAIRRQQKKGMPITYKRGKQIVRKFPDGRIDVLGDINIPNYARPKGIRVLGRK